MPRSSHAQASHPTPPGGLVGPGEKPFWRRAGALWQQLAGNFADSGFSIEWHDWHATEPLHWAGSFHPHSLELCLNIEGTGWVGKDAERMTFTSGTAGFFVLNGAKLEGEREPAQRHKFVSIEFSLEFLRDKLSSHAKDLHPLLKSCLTNGGARTGLSQVTTLNARRQDLLKSLLHPPVLKSAQRLWYESKVLEFAAEFFFSGEGPELFCSRAQKLSQERVSRAKQILLENLADPPSLEELGRQVACSHFYLSRTFTQETGLTISQWLRRSRLERAAELLRTGKCNVTEAAMEVGYSSLSHFSQAFHEVHGCCPGLYPLKTPAQVQSTRSQPS